MVDPKEHWMIQAERLKKDGKFEEAIKILDKIQEIKKEEKDDDFWYKKGIHLCEIGEYEQAKISLEKDLEINNKSYKTFFLYGKVLHQLKNYEEALEFYNKASEELNSMNLKNSNKIDKMKDVHKFEEAVKYSDLVYQQNQLDSLYWYHRGLALFKLKKFGESSSCFENALEKDQNNPTFLYELAKSELWADNIQKSLKILEKTCSLDPLVREKLKIDKDFEVLTGEKQFRVIVDMLKS